jgi:hypothetical protein
LTERLPGLAHHHRPLGAFAENSDSGIGRHRLLEGVHVVKDDAGIHRVFMFDE